VAARVGPMHTAALYVNLFSLMQSGKVKAGDRIAMFSYGSGAASSLFSIKVWSVALGTNKRGEMLEANRVALSAAEFKSRAKEYAASYSHFGWMPKDTLTQTQGVFYVREVDSIGRRLYVLGGGLQRLQFIQGKSRGAKGERAGAVAKVGAAVSPSLKLDDVAGIATNQIRLVAGLGPSVEIDFTRPLAELGFDSLLSVELRLALEREIHVSLPGSLLQDYPTLNALITFLEGEVRTSSLSKQIVVEAGTPAALLSPPGFASREFGLISKGFSAQFDLFVFPPLGFGDVSFKSWHSCSDLFNIYFVGYEFLDEDFDGEINRLVELVSSKRARRALLFGHSLGGIVAFHVASRVVGPEWMLAVSGVSTPLSFLTASKEFPFSAMRNLSDEASILAVLVDAKMIPPPPFEKWNTVTTKVIVGDARFCVTQALPCENILQMPLLAISARSDTLMESNLVAQWRHVTVDRFAFEVIEGTHQYFRRPPPSLFRSLERFALQSNLDRVEDEGKKKASESPPAFTWSI
jgi:surfactin synthase thioesterase subunit/acyl carrier protein